MKDPPRLWFAIALINARLAEQKNRSRFASPRY